MPRCITTTMAPIPVTLVILLALIIVSANYNTASQQTESKQIAPTRKSIVFDLKTPKVFYCPQEKPSGDQLDKIIVKARPLDRLCEFEGKQKPKSAPSDCYNDIDETEFACEEKRRFMIRLDMASEGLDSAGTRETIDDLDYILSNGGSVSRKKALPNEKKKNNDNKNKKSQY